MTAADPRAPVPDGRQAPSDAAARYAAALLSPTPEDAMALTDAFLADGVGARQLYLEVITPAMQRIGSLWERAEISVADEHAATDVAARDVARIGATVWFATGDRGRIVLAGSEDELHTLGLAMVADILRWDGWSVHQAGGMLPAWQLADVVARRRPAVVGISAALVTHLRAVREAIHQIRRVDAAIFVLVGGRGFGGDGRLAAAVGADGFGASGGDASTLLDERFPRAGA